MLFLVTNWCCLPFCSQINQWLNFTVQAKLVYLFLERWYRLELMIVLLRKNTEIICVILISSHNPSTCIWYTDMKGFMQIFLSLGKSLWAVLKWKTPQSFNIMCCFKPNFRSRRWLSWLVRLPSSTQELRGRLRVWNLLLFTDYRVLGLLVSSNLPTNWEKTGLTLGLLDTYIFLSSNRVRHCIDPNLHAKSSLDNTNRISFDVKFAYQLFQNCKMRLR